MYILNNIRINEIPNDAFIITYVFLYMHTLYNSQYDFFQIMFIKQIDLVTLSSA